jgi:hypothetical protein
MVLTLPDVRFEARYQLDDLRIPNLKFLDDPLDAAIARAKGELQKRLPLRQETRLAVYLFESQAYLNGRSILVDSDFLEIKAIEYPIGRRFPRYIESTEYTTTTSSLLTADAASGQKLVLVQDGTIFGEGQEVRIADTAPASEYNTISSIASNTLTMANNLASTYTTGASGYVATTERLLLHLTASVYDEGKYARVYWGKAHTLSDTEAECTIASKYKELIAKGAVAYLLRSRPETENEGFAKMAEFVVDLNELKDYQPKTQKVKFFSFKV